MVMTIKPLASSPGIQNALLYGVREQWEINVNTELLVGVAMSKSSRTRIASFFGRFL